MSNQPSKVLVYTVTRCNTPERARLLASTITSGRDTAGMDFDWHCYTSSDTLGANVLESALSIDQIQRLELWPHNKGQHVANNDAVAHALSHDYTHVIRIDDDVEWISKRWMARLVEASVALDDKFVLSPRVRGLRNPMETSQVVEVSGIPLAFVFDAIGGICRLTPTSLLKTHPWISDVRMPMGIGDAVGIAKWAKHHIIPMAYVTTIKVRHAQSTDGQEQSDPGHFEKHAMFQIIPYIPPLEAPCE
jgi:hypothetical protein